MLLLAIYFLDLPDKKHYFLHKNINRRTKMNKFGFTPEAEILNARLAMLGFVIAVGTYFTTGQIIPGVW
jgi:hypothetical protein